MGYAKNRCARRCAVAAFLKSSKTKPCWAGSLFLTGETIEIVMKIVSYFNHSETSIIISPRQAHTDEHIISCTRCESSFFWWKENTNASLNITKNTAAWELNLIHVTFADENFYLLVWSVLLVKELLKNWFLFPLSRPIMMIN